MTFNAATTVFSTRLIVFLAILFVTLAFGGQPAGAEVLRPNDDAGGSGSATDESAQEVPVLVGSGPERELVAADEVPVLVGSGPEREIVASSQDTASGTLDESERSIALNDLTTDNTTATGSGFDLEFGQTANERSIALIESKEALGGVLAGGDDLDDADTAASSGTLDEEELTATQNAFLYP